MIIYCENTRRKVVDFYTKLDRSFFLEFTFHYTCLNAIRRFYRPSYQKLIDRYFWLNSVLFFLWHFLLNLLLCTLFILQANLFTRSILNGRCGLEYFTKCYRGLGGVPSSNSKARRTRAAIHGHWKYHNGDGESRRQSSGNSWKTYIYFKHDVPCLKFVLKGNWSLKLSRSRPCSCQI